MRTFKNLLCLFMVVLMASCAGQKKVLYFQDLTSADSMEVKRNYEMKISYDDLLSITVSSRSPELVAPFLLHTSSTPSISSKSSTGNLGKVNSSNSGAAEYLVDSEGNIEFPVFGKLHVEGMTRTELMEYIKQRLIKEDYIKDPTVIVKFMNFKVCMMGAVGSPGIINVQSDRITILEAISQAGDLDITGRRDRVTVLREENGMRVPYYLNLKSKDVFNSPCFYLKQNDRVYVEHNKAGTRSSKLYDFTNIGTWTSLISAAISLVTIAVVAD